MTAKRGDRVAPPPGPGEWDVRYGKKEALAGWEDLCRQAPTNTATAWRALRTNPTPQPTPRHHPLRGELASALCQGRPLPQWQIEVTGGGRLWYVVDTEKRTVWITLASTGHPKQTE